MKRAIVKKSGKQEKLRKGRDQFKVYAGVFDNRTLKTLTSLASKKFFNTLDGPVSTGKEADVFKATTHSGEHRALKIYRIETSSFRNMEKYINGDPRFERYKHTKRGVVNVWCQKEFHNLTSAYSAGVRVPKPYKAMENVLVMDFIGKNGVAAPLLKDVGAKDWESVIKEISHFIKLLYKKAHIVHADISEFNVMMLNNKPVLIDIGQAVSVKHPRAQEFLRRDLRNVETLAKKHGVKFDAKRVYEECLR
jgi:RIO kinase 1